MMLYVASKRLQLEGHEIHLFALLIIPVQL